jgi:hypothetical protein
MYKTGGLEVDASQPSEILQADNVDYVVSDKFKMMLRDSFIDWGTFLETYSANMSDSIMFDQVMKLLNVKDNENLRDVMLPLVKKIYHLPAESHMSCMLKQFMVYEPVSIAIHTVFTTIRRHYEELVERFLIARNRFITNENTRDKPNDIDSLNKYWADLNEQYELDTSSLTLLFLNPPKGLKSNVHYGVSGLKFDALKAAIKKFKYPGFCPKVPHERLKALLQFPVNEFVDAIKRLDSGAKFPNYNNLEKQMTKLLSKAPKKPTVVDNYKRLSPDKSITEKIELVKWYVDEILNLRKTLLSYGKAYEEYYVAHAKTLLDVNEAIKEEFNHLH